MSSLGKKQLPPGPRTFHPLGQLIPFRKDSVGFLKSIAQKYGDIVYFKIGPFRLVLLNHPDYIREVLSVQHANFVKGRPLEMAKVVLGEGLLTSEGNFHKRQSRTIQPAFHRKMIASYAPAMTSYTRRLMDSWEDGMELDMLEEMIKLSTGIAGKTLFNVDVEEEAPNIHQALNDIMKLFGRITLPFSEWLLKVPLPSTRRFYRAKAQLDTIIDNIIKGRRQHRLNNGDLLSLLLDAQAGNDGNGAINDQQVRDEALTLFLTAFDTTSLALTWAWYALSQNPEVEARLHQELDQVLEGRTPSVEDIPNLKYTRMVMGESMRLYPPIYIITRQAKEEFAVGGYTLPGGTLVLMSPYLMHRDARFHPAPEKFDPHAWNDRVQRQGAKYEYFPFGGGPRSCIGQSYAWLEGELVLATIAQKWRLKLVPNHPVSYSQLINLRPKYGMRMVVCRRP